MRVSVLLLVLVSFFACVLSAKHARTWGGEWGVHVAEGMNPEFLNELGFTVVKQMGSLQDAYVIKHTEITQDHPAHLINAAHATLKDHQHVVFTDKMYKQRMNKRSVVLNITDPLFPQQWHLNNTGQTPGGVVGQDINVTGVWEMGYIGRGVRIAIVDDGYEYTHPDLAPGYQGDSSFNFNDDNLDPAPGPFDEHGTSAAGVALASNNSVCGIGAAFGAQGSGIRLLAAPFSDADLATALLFRNDVNAIYSNSWGPDDDGETLVAPGYFTQNALNEGVNNGRGGLGSIFIWGTGNGLATRDNCNYDGFANHRATIAVGAVGNDGKQTPYSEPCAAMLVTAPSSNDNVGITTTDLMGEAGSSKDDCTSDFGGTTSACPLVAGVVALMLEANPDLTWRDVQYILLSTAEQNDPTDPGWVKNGAGYHINHKYGFGRVNALAAVKSAIDHENINSPKSATYNNVIVNQSIPDNDTVVGVNKSITINSELVVEHVQISVSIPDFLAGGDLRIILTSPSGTQSILAEQHGDAYGVFMTLPKFDVFDRFLCGTADFGSPFTNTTSYSELVVQAQPSLACGNFTNCADLEGKIALVDQSTTCPSLTERVYNLQECGAILVLVANRYVGPPVTLEKDNSTFQPLITIPTLSIEYDSGMMLKDLEQSIGNVSVNVAAEYYRAEINYDGWTFSTVRNWGESAKGTWTVQIYDELYTGFDAHFASYSMTIYGHSKPFKLPYYVVGIIVGAIVALIFIISIALYLRNKSRGTGYIQMK